LKSNNPIQYYLLSPFQGLKRLAFTSGSSYLSIYKDLGITYYFLKVVFVLLYYGVLFFGFLGVILKIKSDSFSRLSLYILGAVISVICVYSPIQEARYFIHCYVLLMFLSACQIQVIITKKLLN